ncbi:zinc ribbon domain-containing protein YjdM [Demequina sp. B12]|uniref:zinc ribbon domain-containing protein YjdM n=1 Tax=Demequina sp. B12 TaxID=2992757 RepID=UPI00237B3B16|nr:zinc ribbon domain-containing protein YjdM [Demequina sp. B12]MDE0572607.1 zinc ribbon domain-containing protein YjdM [Demequina sp. B12]
MSDSLPACPECAENYTYEQGALLVCPMCGHEWSAEANDAAPAADAQVRDAVGNVLADGDTVTIVKDLKISGGGGSSLKVGTKVKGIRLLAEPVNGHDIDATVPGCGRLQLKSSVVKKA